MLAVQGWAWFKHEHVISSMNDATMQKRVFGEMILMSEQNVEPRFPNDIFFFLQLVGVVIFWHYDLKNSAGYDYLSWEERRCWF